MSSPGFLPDGVHGGVMTPEQCDRLHFLKNRPDPPMVNGFPVEYPPYEYRPFPAAIYTVWTDDRKREELIQIARTQQLNLLIPLERDRAEALLPKWDSRLVQNDRELKDYLANGWAETPDGVEAAQQRRLDAIALQAAHRAHDDLKLSDTAKAEFNAADRANGPDHLLDLPVPKKRGRPKKANPAAPAA